MTGTALAKAHDLADLFLDTLDNRPVWPRATYEEMLEALGGELPAGASEPVDVLEELAVRAGPGIAGIAGGRFFGFVIGVSIWAATTSDDVDRTVEAVRRVVAIL